jgi:hypothetical protein
MTHQDENNRMRHRFVLYQAIELNNTGVTLLNQNCYFQALHIFRESLMLMRDMDDVVDCSTEGFSVYKNRQRLTQPRIVNQKKAYPESIESSSDSSLLE